MITAIGTRRLSEGLCVGQQTQGIDGLALSVTVAALITLPLAGHAHAAITATDFAELALSAGLGVALAYALEMEAIRRTSAKTVSVLFSLDPAVGALAGLLFLGQQLSAASAVGLACVVGAGAGIGASAPTIQRLIADRRLDVVEADPADEQPAYR